VPGVWKWRALSNDADINGKQGSFEVTADGTPAHGFMHVNNSLSFRHSFVTGVDTPFFPAYLKEPAIVAAAPAASDAVQSFHKRVDAIALVGFNRLTGGYILLRDNTGNMVVPPGAISPFSSPDKINTAFFDALDERVA